MKTKSLMEKLGFTRWNPPVPILIVIGPLLGLAYIVILPFIGVAAIIFASGYRVMQRLAPG